MGVVTTLPRGRGFIRADLDAMPDDGRRYELVDGSLIVTPAPSIRHQIVVMRLVVLLDAACPSDLRVLPAPLDVALTGDSVLQPDVLVARRTDLTEKDLPVAPVLVIEVLSPSTRRVDLTLKRSRYEDAGCPSYWVVDPDGPSITTWVLQGDRYVDSGHVSGDQSLDVTTPYPLILVPARLLD